MESNNCSSSVKYQVLKNTAFGFVFELKEEGTFFTKNEYELYINGSFIKKDNRQVVSIFGLNPKTNYKVEVKFDSYSTNFEIRTENVEYVINVKDYNAKGDLLNNDTSAIAAAIYSAPEGAVVKFPKGKYLVDQILLKSNVNLYLEDGAVLVHNCDRHKLAILKGYQKNYDHSKAVLNATWEGNPLDCFCSLIYGNNIHDVDIYGSGVLNGSGEDGDWWKDFRTKRGAWRPRNISLIKCKNISVSGITSFNSAAWNVHPVYCDDVSFYGLKIESDPKSPNTDGLNPESCENVEIVGCHFKVGDDCIALKSGKAYMSKFHLRPCKNISIRKCYMQEGHGALVIGSEMSCGVYNLEVSDCVFEKTDRGLRIKTRRGRGKTAITQNISFNNIYMDNVKHCFVINMFYCCDPDGHTEYVSSKDMRDFDEWTPSIRDVKINNINAENITGSAIFAYGLPESKIENITLENSKFSFAEKRLRECPAMMDDPVLIDNIGIFIENAVNIDMNNNIFQGKYQNYIQE